MGRAFAIEPAEWPKVVKRLAGGETMQELADAYGVSLATIGKTAIRAKGEAPKAAGEQAGPKATNGKPKTPTNGAVRKLLTSEAGNEIVMPKIMEWISAFYHAQHDPAELPRLQRANAALVLLAADIQAEL